MSVYVMADLHLSTNSETNKAMDVFGARWSGYLQKIKKNWEAVIDPEDTVIVPGDISWAMTLEEALSDLKFLDSLPGQKIIGKGNHDFWWSTATKIYAFFEKHEIHTIKLLYNNAHLVEDMIVCGTRGWFGDEKMQNTTTDANYEKIVAREATRLALSLKEAEQLRSLQGQDLPILVFLHFPPVFNDIACEEIVSVLEKYNIKRCYYGHVHGNYLIPRMFSYKNTEFIITSADYLNFAPMPIYATAE